MSDSYKNPPYQQIDQADAPQRMHWTPELVERFWNGFSQTRLTELSFSSQAGRSLIIAVDHLLSRNGRILDFGAGNGHLVKLMCERGLRVAAYEPSGGRTEDLMKFLGNSPGFLGVINEESTETFDTVVMAEVIEHILDEQLENTLARVAGLTRPGGVLIVTTPNNEDLELGMVYCPVSNMLFHRWQHVRSFTETSLSELLSRSGFDEIVTHCIEFNDALYIPTDPVWGSMQENMEIPSYIREMRANNPVRTGSQQNLLYLGRKRM